MDDVRYWAESVDVTDMRDGDFEKRTASISVWDGDGTCTRRADSLAAHWDVQRAVAIDRAIRLFLTHCEDTRDFDIDRAEHDISVLIPTVEWLREHVDAPITTLVEDTGCRRTVVSSIPPTVDTLIDELVEAGVYDQRSDVARAALDWLVAGE